ncbi:MAG: hypothetical protein A2511_12355 [Deltaproteobacteria bacterium RIFOXYD12_FULL_50_9]|nr:MAG: hypothetical protein A2511_12355 [Deltaproteobacteria bacterium RIFOXYD12_FULL_50_9]
MIRINLLPIRQLKKRIQCRNEIIAFIAVICIVLVGIGAWGFLISNQIKKLNGTITSLTQKRDSFKPTIVLMEQIKKDKQALETKLEAIKKLKNGAQVMVRLLDDIAGKTPVNTIWLESLALAPNDNNMRLSGIALDNAAIAQYMNELNSSKYFKNTELEFSNERLISGKKLKAFSLKFSVTSLIKEEKPAVQPPDKKEKKK